LRSMKEVNNSSVAGWRRVLVAGWLALSLTSLSGCILAAAGAGAGVVAYARGELETNLNSEYASVLEAARGAMADLEFARPSENKDALKAVLISRPSMDKKVEITLANSGKKLTNIKIRVGVFGDQELSLLILDKIKARL
jgi:hypothetical protein